MQAIAVEQARHSQFVETLHRFMRSSRSELSDTLRHMHDSGSLCTTSNTTEYQDSFLVAGFDRGEAHQQHPSSPRQWPPRPTIVTQASIDRMADPEFQRSMLSPQDPMRSHASVALIEELMAMLEALMLSADHRP